MLLRKIFRKIIRWTDRKLRESEDRPGDPYNSSLKASPMPSTAGSLTGNGNAGMNFVVYGATGGKIVEFSSYDQHTGRQNRNLYIVTDKEDLGEELSLIITKESLTR